MRLELKEITRDAAAPAGQSKWFFERGRRTLGRAPDCDWRLPEDRRSVSKLHCIIERDREGFLLRDQSANGSRVDGVAVHEGQIVRLADRSRLELGGLAFSVHISGEKDREIEDPDAGLMLSDEPLTISAILADIAPGGHTANGILGERAVDDWGLPEKAGKKGAASSRNVEIGWSGPPEIRSVTQLLPEDWNSEETEYGSHLEHGSATHVSAPITQRRPAPVIEIVSDNDPQAEPEAEEFPALTIGRPEAFADRLEPLLARLEEAVQNSYAVFEINAPSAASEPVFLAASSREEALFARTETLLGQQLKLNSALEALVQTAGRLEPRMLEARVETGAWRLPWGRDRAYWRAYRAQFEQDGRSRSIHDVFRDAMTGAVNGTQAGPRPQDGQEGKDAHHEE
ncbi:FHA domain-containing protein (plasmid) [Rhizobium leguminosarum]|uniref:FHA domain protein involved in nitrogen fixation n=1 Tax=Rhizobium johnstonii (strain DSM 114642 / LMG 32736 / 3841) TaxID=216596 RepID=Q1M3Z7_RHIJ3|nr:MULTISPECIES: FHA domain-containing protein [Rhizobium]MBY5377963.1 FHA domain-containing protein [Rhizobium leguminosarum]NEI93805.1 FHA domain-containing protein [Rhizobium leguminosarum]NEJ80096.1 FHA domain-containing protein [Rhizobium leguminosarum]TBF23271.1 FHA domain-containing protein [Rhizobium leguminosarum]TBF27837.1 FHA domain-containing protein [Rhizobium leguminosarum]